VSPLQALTRALFWSSTVHNMQFIRRNTGYGLRALVHMAASPDGASFTAQELAEAAETAVRFMHKTLQGFRNAGIVASKRGPGGGFRLAKSPAGVILLDAVKALQELLTISRCVIGLELCHRSGTCPLRPTWVKVQREMERALADTTFADTVTARAARR